VYYHIQLGATFLRIQVIAFKIRQRYDLWAVCQGNKMFISDNQLIIRQKRIGFHKNILNIAANMAANVKRTSIAEESPLHGINHNNLITRRKKSLRDKIGKTRSTMIVIGIVIVTKDT